MDIKIYIADISSLIMHDWTPPGSPLSTIHAHTYRSSRVAKMAWHMGANASFNNNKKKYTKLANLKAYIPLLS